MIMFAVAAFVFGTVAQEFWRGTGARRAMWGEAPPLALVSLVRRNRRRYGGYLVHLGIAVLFVGVAASTAFEHERDVRLRPGQTTTLGNYRSLRRATGDIDVDSDGSLEKIDLGAVLDVSARRRAGGALAPERGYYPSPDVAGLGMIGRFFEGEATSEVGLDAGPWRRLDRGAARLAPLRPLIEQGDALYASASLAPRRVGDVPRPLAGGLVDRYVRRRRRRIPPDRLAARGWIWIGALIAWRRPDRAVAGADAARRRATARDAARVARDLGGRERAPAQPGRPGFLGPRRGRARPVARRRAPARGAAAAGTRDDAERPRLEAAQDASTARSAS